MALTINSNIASLVAQRRFAQSTDALSESFARLSSGLRINRARDDAAGLAIAENLNVDSRVFSQGIRNVNDGISLLNIAEGAAQELSSIVIRQRELATQASNGTLSGSQRLALHEEANALVDEYNRILATTSFNGETLLVANDESRRVQAGYGEQGGVDVELANDIARTVGDGTYAAAIDSTGSGSTFGFDLADFNNDGLLDVGSVSFTSGALSVMLGNGDGTFKAATSYAIDSNFRITAGDFNGDGFVDVAGVGNGGGGVRIALGNGDGSFKAKVDQGNTFNSGFIQTEDFNGDGALDLFVDDTSGGTGGKVLLNDGAGSFTEAHSVLTGARSHQAAIEDFNNDGIFDVATGLDNGRVSVALGNADGSFRAAVSYVTEGSGNEFTLVAGDFNNDGNQDFVSGNYENDALNIFLGQGDGTFKAGAGITSFNTPDGFDAADINGDGNLDFVVSFESEGSFGTYLGQGDGTFAEPVTVSSLPGSFAIALEDLDEDGALDVVTGTANNNTIRVFRSNTTLSSTMDALDLRTRDRALRELSVLDETLDRVNKELGAIGASQSRLQVAAGNLAVGRENFNAASSQIADVDVAFESARLVRGQILQQAGAAVLAQANQQPALVQALLSRV